MLVWRQLYLTLNRPQRIHLDGGTLSHGHVVNNGEENFMVKVRKCIFLILCALLMKPHRSLTLYIVECSRPIF